MGGVFDLHLVAFTCFVGFIVSSVFCSHGAACRHSGCVSWLKWPSQWWSCRAWHSLRRQSMFVGPYLLSFVLLICNRHFEFRSIERSAFGLTNSRRQRENVLPEVGRFSTFRPNLFKSIHHYFNNCCFNRLLNWPMYVLPADELTLTPVLSLTIWALFILCYEDLGVVRVMFIPLFSLKWDVTAMWVW